jgi:hypothetical protein
VPEYLSQEQLDEVARCMAESALLFTQATKRAADAVRVSHRGSPGNTKKMMKLAGRAFDAAWDAIHPDTRSPAEAIFEIEVGKAMHGLLDADKEANDDPEPND